jgi:hypothetical protein
MVWAVSLSTTKLSPRCLTCMQAFLAFAVCVGVVTSTWPLAHTALYLQESGSYSCTSIHFGENQLSPRSISISPLSTVHPPVLQHWWVRASTDCHIRFTLTMDSSRGFGSHRRNVCALFRLGCPLAPQLYRWLTCYADALAGSFYKRHAISPWFLLEQWPLTACEYVVSGSLSSPSRGAFHLSLTVLVRYRSLKMLSLGGWSPQLPTRFHVPRGTQDADPCSPVVLYGTLTRSGVAFQRLRVTGDHLLSVLQPHRSRGIDGLGSSRFARHYYGNLG